MGTWGYGPFECDGASDLVASLMRSINLVLDRKTPETARYHYGEARAAASLIVFAHGSDILGGPDLEQVLRALARMRSDSEWLQGFKEPRKVAKSLTAEMQTVLSAMTSRRGRWRQRKLTKRELDDLFAIVDAATAVSIPAGRRKRHFPTRRPTTKRRAPKMATLGAVAQGLPKKKARAGRRAGS